MDYTAVHNLFKALCEETRYRIIETLIDGEKCACEIPVIIGRKQSNTSMHLSKLTDWGILSARKDGRSVIYSIKDRRVVDILNVLK